MKTTGNIIPHSATADNPSVRLSDLNTVPLWAAYRVEVRPGRSKPTKPPRNPQTGMLAAVDDPATWGKRRTAERRAESLKKKAEGRATGIGIMLAPMPGHPGLRLCGADLDGCRAPEGGPTAPWARVALDRLATYAEVSPSGTGAHALFLVHEADIAALRSEKLLAPEGETGEHGRTFALPGGELAVFFGGKFLTVTEQQLGEVSTIRRVPLDTLRWLLGHYGPSLRTGRESSPRGGTAGRGGGDDSGSGHGFRFACDRMREGLDDDEVREAFVEEDDTQTDEESKARDWWGRCGDHQRDNVIRNARLRIDKELSNVIDLFDDISADDKLAPDGEDPLGERSPIEEMNRRHAVVRLPNRTAVACFHEEGVDFLSKHDLGSLYANKPLGKGTWASEWMKHPDRREYPNGVAFDPAGRERAGVLNLWTGFAVRPDPDAECGRIIAHIRNVICAGDAEHFRYVIGWLADMVQNPARKPGVALVLRGGKGAGKDTLGLIMSGIVGTRHTAHIDKPDLLTQRFNAHFETALFAHVEEAFWAGDRSKQGILQSLITAPTMTLERKGVDPIRVGSYVRVLMTTNADWAVPASHDERRYAVFDVSDARRGDRDYFAALYRKIEHGGVAGFLAYLLAVDLSGFEVRDMPRTSALLAQKIASLQGFERYWFEVLTDGELPSDFGGEDGWEDGPLSVPRETLRESYERFHRRHTWQGDLLDARQIGKTLRVLCPEMEDTRRGARGERHWHYNFPPLERCRQLFSQGLDNTPDGIEWHVSSESDGPL